jgi:ankyrin repeat protein
MLAISSAFRCRHIEIVKLLLKYGANIHVDNNWILRSAERNNMYKFLSYINSYIDRTKFTPLTM